MELKQIMSSVSAKHLRTRLTCKCRDCEWEMQQDLEGSEIRAARDGDLVVESRKHAAGDHILDLHTEYFYELSKAETIPDLPISSFLDGEEVVCHPSGDPQWSLSDLRVRLIAYSGFWAGFAALAIWFAATDSRLSFTLAVLAQILAASMALEFGYTIARLVFLKGWLCVRWRRKRHGE
ncbi:MAG: hypothetical protein ICCCNLDF_02828 [Planctomycetes bacterium]|nr:hypothetical protein [Planctomycetota bacterium]